MGSPDLDAPGVPGIEPTWSSSAKDTVGTALGASRVWYTLGFGIVNEVYWPSCSTPQIRDLGFIVAGDGFWSEVKRVNDYTLRQPAPDIPLPTVVHRHPRYRLELEVMADPDRDVLLIRHRLEGDGLRLYVLLAPHLAGSGHDNTALAETDLAAVRAHNALVLAADGGLARCSAGYVGYSDGWQDFHRNGGMTWCHRRAARGNVALLGELNDRDGVLALGLADTVEGARTLARSSLAMGVDSIRQQFMAGWQAWNQPLGCEIRDPDVSAAVRCAITVLKVHADRTYPGALIASLSVPWGDHHDDPGGYHLVWPRDAVESGLAFLACGHGHRAHVALAYLIATQHRDGHWSQNFFADGRPYWTGVQLDEAALPVLLAARLEQRGCLGDLRPQAVTMARRALRFIADAGPISPQDRWEENPGISPFTLGVCIAALVAAAEHGFLEDSDRNYALSLADDWNARLESWIYVEDTELDRRHGTRGHYIRIASGHCSPQRGDVVLRNRDGEHFATRDLLGLEYLYLVRLGLRAADDPRIVDTTRLVDAILRVETPSGAYYHRYNDDGYGEHADGSAFDGSGIGRAWPLLAGERGHYALLAGEDPQPYLQAMLRAASPGGMLPEQVWDAAPIPELGLFPGRPSHGAMPLVWAHAELIKLAVAMHTGEAIECLPGVAQRFARHAASPRVRHWRDATPLRSVPRGGALLIEGDAPFVLHLGRDAWQDIRDLQSTPYGLGRHGVAIEPQSLGARQRIVFTRRFSDARGWEGQDWSMVLQPTPAVR